MDDDRSSALDSLDIDWDDSFRSVLTLILNFHGMEEPAGIPSARCQDFSCVDLWVDVGDLSGIPPADLSLVTVVSGRH